MYDIAVIGAGIVGAAIAYELSRFQLKTCLLEKEPKVCNGATKANSGIVHAGYDPPYGTEMAKLNVLGSQMMSALCKALDVHYLQNTSFVAGFDEGDMKTLQRLYENGRKNGVKKLVLLNGDEARAMEPHLSPQVKGVLWAQTAAIIDPLGLCMALCEVAVKNGVDLYCNAEVTALQNHGAHFFLGFQSRAPLQAKIIINAVGAHADHVHHLAGGDGFTLKVQRGEYDILDKSMGQFCARTLFQCPDQNGKGVLVTPTVHGNLLIGPNNQETDKDDVSTTPAGMEEVHRLALRLCPTLTFSDSIRQFAGLRAIAAHADDFIIAPSPQVPRIINVAGIKSPGLSAAPAIAKKVVDILDGMDVPLVFNPSFDGHRRHIYFNRLSPREKQRLIAQNPLYGHVICRCQQVTEGEILDALASPLGLKTLDDIKAYCTPGMGRCQGGFCGPKIVRLIADTLHIPPHEVLKGGQGSYILCPGGPISQSEENLHES